MSAKKPVILLRSVVISLLLMWSVQPNAMERLDKKSTVQPIPALVSIVLGNKETANLGEDLRFQVILQSDFTFSHKGLLEFFLQPGNNVRLATYSGDKPLRLTNVFADNSKIVYGTGLYLGNTDVFLHEYLKNSNISLLPAAAIQTA